jgi:hypothetical protein
MKITLQQTRKRPQSKTRATGAKQTMKPPTSKDTTYPVKRTNVPVSNDIDMDEDREAGPDRGGNVDKIRDILFGNQMRDYDKRFSRFEERLLKETSDLREDVKRRFAAIEAYIKNELTALSDRQKADQAANGEAVKEIGRDLKEAVKANEKKATQLEEQNAKAQRDLRQQILEESKRLTDEIEQKTRELSTVWESESRDLRGSFADRLALADLFAEVSLRLKNGSAAAEKR